MPVVNSKPVKPTLHFPIIPKFPREDTPANPSTVIVLLVTKDIVPKAEVMAPRVGEILASATGVVVPKLHVPDKPVVNITLQSPEIVTETLPSVAETAGHPTLAEPLAMIVPKAEVPT